ncbi:MAG: hypothetical protein K0Q90_1461, partial [Paenibacillaceae bacterium]|nr:hypothetical protein [Paenibacillaceae bacterium]
MANQHQFIVSREQVMEKLGGKE